MIKVLKSWYNKHFSDRDAVILFLVFVVIFGLIATMGSILAPILASIVIAYLLQGWTKYLERLSIPRFPAYLIIYLTFLAIFIAVLLLFLPLVVKQITALIAELPLLLQKSKALLIELSKEYPAYFSEQQLSSMLGNIVKELQGFGKVALSASFSTLSNAIAFMIYLVLIPMMVFFFLKDDKKIIAWFTQFLPRNRRLLSRVWSEIDNQLGNYVGGKVTEIVVVGVVSYLAFLYFGLNYALLLATMVGLSVIVPYVGAVVVTIPVAIVAYLQWGWTADFGYLMLTYLIIQALDGNLLVPILFSEAVNLHPVAIVAAIIVFGSVWGFWGVFFAIPLATVVKTIINAWPRHQDMGYNKRRHNRSNNFKRKPHRQS